MSAVTLRQRLFRREEDRRAIALGLLAAAGALLFALLCAGLDDLFAARAAEARSTSLAEDAPVTDPRVCAAVVVYTQATADDWAQRAVLARASLNASAHRPIDCRSSLTTVVGQGIDPRRWQLALDAVDAVASGSYPVPLACARVNAVLPAAARLGSPLFQAGARAQCIIRDLAFVELRP